MRFAMKKMNKQLMLHRNQVSLSLLRSSYLKGVSFAVFFTYLSDCLHTLIGQFCGPLSPVRQRDVQQAIFEISNIQLDSEAVRTKTIETQ